MTIVEAYDFCEEATHRASSNFYWGIRILPTDRRRGLSAVYAFARQIDDLADAADPARGSDAERLARLRRMRDEFRAALKGPAGISNPVLVAAADAVARFSLTPKYLDRIFDGAEQDMTVSRYETFEALKAYCHLVASSVGLISLELFGCREEKARPMAEHLGVAFQVTNILRDVGEDARRGRIYLPQEDLEAAGCSETDILRGTTSEAFLKVCALNAARARRHFEMAHPLLEHLGGIARRAVAHMASVYSALLTRIESGGFPGLNRREALGRVEKALILLQVLFRPTYPIPPQR